MSTVRWSDIRESTSRRSVARTSSAARLGSSLRFVRTGSLTCKRRGLTQREVAQAMGVTVGRVSQIETANCPASTFLTVTSPLSAASSKSSRTSVTNSSRSADRRT